MAYIESNLLADETVVHRASLHWLVYWQAIVAGVAGVALVWIEPLAGAIAFALAVVLAIPPFIAKSTSEFGVTSKRVIIKVGLIQRRTPAAACGGRGSWASTRPSDRGTISHPRRNLSLAVAAKGAARPRPHLARCAKTRHELGDRFASGTAGLR